MESSTGPQWILKVIAASLLAFVLHNHCVIPRLGNDDARQLVALENIKQGHGVTFQFVADGNREPFLTNAFPMGYYILMMPFYAISSNAVLTHRVLLIVGLILLVYQLFKLGYWVGERYGIRNFVWWMLLFTLIQLNPWRTMRFTDVWALMLFITALRLVITKFEYEWRHLIAIGLLAYSCVSMRYAYYPLAFIPPIFAILRYEKPKIRSFTPIIIMVLLLLGTHLFNRIYFGNMDHIEARVGEERWFFEHIIQMDPVGFNAFFYDHVVLGAFGLDRLGQDTAWWAKHILSICSLSILTVLLLSTIRTFHFKLSNLVSGRCFLPTILWTTVLVKVGFLSAISIYYPSKEGGFMYTWQLVTRYYSPVYLSMQMLLVLLVFKDKQFVRKRILRSLFIFSLVFQLVYGIRFLHIFSFSDTWGNYTKFQTYREMPAVIKNYKQLLNDPHKELHIPPSQFEYEYLAIYYLTGPERLTAYLEEHCPECLEYYAQ